MPDRTVTTAATGRTSAPPDEVTVQLSSNAVEPDVMAARRGVAERAARLRSVLADAGVPGDRVRTIRFTVTQRPPHRTPHCTRESEDDPESRPYEATETLIVTLGDLDSVGEVLTAAVDDAGAEVDTVNFGFRTETERELDREAVADAAETARKRAEAAAAAEGLRVGDVRSIATDQEAMNRRTASGLGEALQESGSQGPESGPMDVTARVEATYELCEE
ncbi:MULTISPECIES: SIMPL domain-containing protein [Halorussus]|uniref:SIMPL domain-containing protein n=1 Tax=Halorussus TaxID=1070314 RepID=UPI0020A14AAA|nr:SIMPL domain-containing protein [Halorussus vallis]USZ77978.1 SIMPL domain-containing protein [Halorussus vallis]USZ78010.1 SIMPL domain-containing protein [Halorussus vallis]